MCYYGADTHDNSDGLLLLDTTDCHENGRNHCGRSVSTRFTMDPDNACFLEGLLEHI